MKIGLFSDAHGNSIGLKIALDYLIKKESIKKLFFLGDAGGYFSDINEVINLLRENNVFCLLGNHDAMLLGRQTIDPEKEPIYKLITSQKRLSKNNQIFLNQQLPFYSTIIDNKKFLFVHGSPFDPLNTYIYPDYDLSSFKELPFDVVFMGHTHRPFVKKINHLSIVNVGSCGLPRDQGNLISCVVYDTNTDQIMVKRILMNTDLIIKQYGHFIHPEVKNCLYRRVKN